MLRDCQAATCGLGLELVQDLFCHSNSEFGLQQACLHPHHLGSLHSYVKLSSVLGSSAISSMRMPVICMRLSATTAPCSTTTSCSGSLLKYSTVSLLGAVWKLQ